MKAKITITKSGVQITQAKTKHMKWLAVMGKMIQDKIEPGDVAVLTITPGQIDKSPLNQTAEVNPAWRLDCTNQAVS